MKAKKLISTTTAALVIFLALAAFVLSYDALRALAAVNGINHRLAYLWPLTLDGFIIVASLSVLRNSLLAERTLYAWLLIVGFSLASIGFNILHAPGNLTAQAIAAVPPLALLLSFELLMSQLKSEVRRRSAFDSLAELAAKAQNLAAEITGKQADFDVSLAERDRELTTKGQKLADLQGQIDRLNSQIRETKRGQFADKKPDSGQFIPGDPAALDQANETRQARIEARRGQLVDILAADPDLTNADLADRLEVSLSTVKADKLALNGRLSLDEASAGKGDEHA
jgi:hypothetical protein